MGRWGYFRQTHPVQGWHIWLAEGQRGQVWRLVVDQARGRAWIPSWPDPEAVTSQVKDPVASGSLSALSSLFEGCRRSDSGAGLRPRRQQQARRRRAAHAAWHGYSAC